MRFYTCSSCGKRKPDFEFHAEHAKYNGLQKHCKACNLVHKTLRPARRKTRKFLQLRDIRKNL